MRESRALTRTGLLILVVFLPLWDSLATDDLVIERDSEGRVTRAEQGDVELAITHETVAGKVVPRRVEYGDGTVVILEFDKDGRGIGSTVVEKQDSLPNGDSSLSD